MGYWHCIGCDYKTGRVELLETHRCGSSGRWERCRCGSGAHPRRCELHPHAYDRHVYRLNEENRLDGELEELRAQLTASRERERVLAALVRDAAENRRVVTDKRVGAQWERFETFEEWLARARTALAAASDSEREG